MKGINTIGVLGSEPLDLILEGWLALLVVLARASATTTPRAARGLGDVRGRTLRARSVPMIIRLPMTTPRANT
eukprot:5461791-Pyramimonas_sp.AAC.1